MTLRFSRPCSSSISLLVLFLAEDKENTVTNDNFAEEKGSSLNAAYGDEELQDFGEGKIFLS